MGVREGRLRPSRTPTNRRVYTDEHWYQVLPQRRAAKRTTVVYRNVLARALKEATP